MKADHDRVSKLLTDTVTLLCKNGVSYERDLKIQALIAVTIDGNDVFVVQVNECFPLASQTLTLPAESTQSTTPLQCESTVPPNKRRMRSEDVVDLTRLVETPAVIPASFSSKFPSAQNARFKMHNIGARKNFPHKHGNIRNHLNQSAPPPRFINMNKSNEKSIEGRSFSNDMMRPPHQLTQSYAQNFLNHPPGKSSQFIECLENSINQLDRNNSYIYPTVPPPFSLPQNQGNSGYRQFMHDMRMLQSMDSCQGSLHQIMEYENFSRNQEIQKYTEPYLPPLLPEIQSSANFFRPMMPPLTMPTNHRNTFQEPAPPKQRSPRVRVTEQHVDLCSESENIFENAIFQDITSLPQSSIIIQPDYISDITLLNNVQTGDEHSSSMSNNLTNDLNNLENMQILQNNENNNDINEQDINITTTNL